MKHDTRFSAMLHLLLHMADRNQPITSDELARYMAGNAAAVRRTMAGLRAAGIVRSGKGHGGGWTLGRPLQAISLADVYAALGTPDLFAIGIRNPAPSCLVERAVNASMQETLGEAERLVQARLQSITLASIAAELRARMAKLPLNPKEPHDA
ncbi:Rrf2 family transcriptional regulator [Aquibium carbonis]|uniref:Rrf2 family transcriptional regulator n=1 Tax=Aquibium carbonis TaxID=2495581 RepID=A0A3R9Y6L0_9HYPH|nr:Rrf2 family transcriptional regulator [Aquibium carbonis]RST85300.1 Rrf2 family transcriptional regulator [Aquibium carbonis]